MSNECRFSERERRLLRSLVMSSSAEPSFEMMKSCLIWQDECPEKMSGDGLSLLGDLWATRGFIHRKVPEERWGLGPDYFRRVWAYALEDIPEWPGFRRMKLSEKDQRYLEESLREMEGATDY
jgi:hypothetical protein